MSDSDNPVEDLDRLFKSDRGWLVKIVGAGIVGLATAGLVVFKNRSEFSFVAKLVTLAAVPTAVMLGAAVLIRADVVRRRLKAGGQIGLFSRMLFGGGIWSFVVWIILALLIGFPLAIWLGSMTSGAPPR